MRYKILKDWCTDRYSDMLYANREDIENLPEREQQYWLGRRHELKYIMETFGIEVPPLRKLERNNNNES